MKHKPNDLVRTPFGVGLVLYRKDEGRVRNNYYVMMISLAGYLQGTGTYSSEEIVPENDPKWIKAHALYSERLDAARKAYPTKEEISGYPSDGDFGVIAPDES